MRGGRPKCARTRLTQPMQPTQPPIIRTSGMTNSRSHGLAAIVAGLLFAALLLTPPARFRKLLGRLGRSVGYP
jgi:hypothetical protein